MGDKVLLIVSLRHIGGVSVRNERALIIGCNRLRVGALRLLIVRVLFIEVLINLGSNTLTNTVEMHQALTSLDLIVQIGDNICSLLVSRRLVEIIRGTSKINHTIDKTLIGSATLGCNTRGRVVQRRGPHHVLEFIEFIEGIDLLFVGLCEKLLELLNLGSRLFNRINVAEDGANLTEFGVLLLELEDVVGNRTGVHGSRHVVCELNDYCGSRAPLRCLKIRLLKNVENVSSR